MSRPDGRWNSGRAVGPRTAFTQSEITALMAALREAEAWRDLALLLTGLDSMLRASDLLRLRAADVMRGAEIRERIAWRQQKTGGNVHVTLTPQTRLALAAWIGHSDKGAQDFLFTALREPNGAAISASTYRRLVKSWAVLIKLDPTDYSSHSIRRSKPVFMYRAGCPIGDISKLLGHQSTDVTLRYLGITDDHLHAQALKYDLLS